MLDSDTRFRLKEAIRQHLASRGGVEWDLVQEEFPEVPPATFWRYVAKVRAEPAPTAQLDAARAFISDRFAPANEREAAITANLPCMPSPDFIAKSGSEGLKHLDLLSHFSELFGDVERLRWSAMDKDGRIIDPAVFVRAIKARIELLDATLKAIDAVYDQRRTTAFYDAVVNEVAAASPETQAKIMCRLRKLNEERGYSFGDGTAVGPNCNRL